MALQPKAALPAACHTLWLLNTRTLSGFSTREYCLNRLYQKLVLNVKVRSVFEGPFASSKRTRTPFTTCQGCGMELGEEERYAAAALFSLALHLTQARHFNVCGLERRKLPA